MRIAVTYPPLYDRICAVFPEAARPGVVFTFGSVLYNPSGGRVSAVLMKHEEVHAERQTDEFDKILSWWERYLVDPAFRIEEELPAHQAEYKAYCKRHGSGREKFLTYVAARLASPLYGLGMTLAEARLRVMGV